MFFTICDNSLMKMWFSDVIKADDVDVELPGGVTHG
jgi:hypothetical protein